MCIYIYNAKAIRFELKFYCITAFARYKSMSIINNTYVYMYIFVAAVTAAAATILQCMPHSISVSFHTCFAFLSVNRR